MVTVDRLYELYNIICDAKEDGSKHESKYKEILTGAKGSPSERRLSSQFISKFFHLFPNQQDQALNCQFDLCEDSDILIRKQAIKDLPILCKTKKEIIPKVSDILAQLLQMEDQTEVSTIHSSLTTLFKLDAKGTLVGLFYQIENSEDEVVRERCMKFIQSKLVSLGPEIFKADSEELIFNEAKKVLQDASEDEFVLMMAILKELKLTKTLKGYQQMVDIISDQCDLSQTFDPTDLESIHRLSTCLKHAVPYFSSVIRSTKFVDYLCQEVLPYINQLETSAAAEQNSSSSLTLDLLKILAELLRHAGEIENTEGKVATVYAKLMEVMPLPPDGDAATEAIETGVSLEFSRVECLLYIFHHLAKHHTEYLSDNTDRLKDFRIRLQYFSRASQAYQKKLRESIAGKKGDELKTEESTIKLIALKTTANINTLIKDLFHQPPSYKSTLTLSWNVGGKNYSEKRHLPITYDTSPNKSLRSDRQIYAPPRDKYSRGAGQFSRGTRSRGRSTRGRFSSYRGSKY